MRQNAFPVSLCLHFDESLMQFVFIGPNVSQLFDELH